METYNSYKYIKNDPSLRYVVQVQVKKIKLVLSGKEEQGQHFDILHFCRQVCTHKQDVEFDI